jgi:hypothetical protein
MKAVTQRGLENAIKLLIQSPEFDRIRLFLVADASQGSGEGEEIIKMIGDELRNHLISHQKAVAAIKKGL